MSYDWTEVILTDEQRHALEHAAVFWAGLVLGSTIVPCAPEVHFPLAARGGRDDAWVVRLESGVRQFVWASDLRFAGAAT